ncbi:FAD-binding oxidoreductase [uncultured Ilyobacter sp.]|uniref:FAD-binding oxidoreductase n=1 Tax=uncultured Ilyobacter sp. TaxID=544433 RepID=UPI0037489418
MEEKYSEYLSDESKLIGKAESISFPKSKDEVLEVIKYCKNNSLSITIQGGNSGIVGGSVPNNNHILNSLNLNKIYKIDDETLIVQCGVNLNDLNNYLERECKNFFFPVDPTEKTATIGGVIASGSKGPNSYYYGDPSLYIEEVTVIFSDLSVKVLSKEDELFSKIFSSEGMYGFILEAKIKLLKKPNHIWGITFFFENLQDVCGFAEEVKKYKCNTTAKIVCGEFMDKNTIDLIEEFKKNMSKIKAISSIPLGYNHLVYIELHSEIEEDLEEIIEFLMDVAIDNNSDVEIAWAVSEDRDLENIKNYRHASAECVNIVIDKMKSIIPDIRKIGLDISMEKNLCETMKRYSVKDIHTVMFGHIFSSHLHLNFLPENTEEFQKSLELVKNLSFYAKNQGGNIVTEHGVGKLKKEIFQLCARESEIEDIKKIKQDLDRENIFDPNNII